MAEMKKSELIRKIAIIVFLTIGASLSARAQGYVKKGPEMPWDIILISADVLSAGAAVWAVSEQISAADRYEKLYSEINASTEDNYYRLLYEREKVNSKETTALIAVSAAVVLLAYTAADLLFLKNAFPLRLKHAGSGFITVGYANEF